MLACLLFTIYVKFELLLFFYLYFLYYSKNQTTRPAYTIQAFVILIYLYINVLIYLKLFLTTFPETHFPSPRTCPFDL